MYRTVQAGEMPDYCHDRCDDDAIYYPWKWRNGIATYRCTAGHLWTCGWGHEESGNAPWNSGEVQR